MSPKGHYSDLCDCLSCIEVRFRREHGYPALVDAPPAAAPTSEKVREAKHAAMVALCDDLNALGIKATLTDDSSTALDALIAAVRADATAPLPEVREEDVD